jgi:hypothetical protein
VASSRVAEALIGVGFGVLGLVSIIFSLLFLVVQCLAAKLSPERGRLMLDHLRPHDARSPGSCRPRAPRRGAAAR